MENAFLILSMITVLLLWVPKLDKPYWIIAGQEYFKVYYLFFGVILALNSFFFISHNIMSSIVLVFLIISIIVALKDVIIFTPFSKKELPSSKKIIESCRLKVMILNVYQTNHHYDKCLDLVRTMKPDIICLLETNKKWDDGLMTLKRDYPYSLKRILENTYGMICYSKMPWKTAEIIHFNKSEVPAMDMLFNLEDQLVRILMIHPEPPIYGEAETIIPKRKEIVRAGFYLAQKLEKGENCILMGDLNDVPWSKSSKLFKDITMMKDPRIGRGFHSTFPAYFYFKIPLDHIFCSDKFEINDLKLSSNFGSDHLSVFADLQLACKDGD